MPHIYAKNEADLFFAQGFNVARDRLFQIDLWYRRGLGQLAEVFGPSYVEQDKATRLFLYRGAMKKEWEVYRPGTEEMFQQFTAAAKLEGYTSLCGASSRLRTFLASSFAANGFWR